MATETRFVIELTDGTTEEYSDVIKMRQRDNTDFLAVTQRGRQEVIWYHVSTVRRVTLTSVNGQPLAET